MLYVETILESTLKTETRRFSHLSKITFDTHNKISFQDYFVEHSMYFTDVQFLSISNEYDTDKEAIVSEGTVRVVFLENCKRRSETIENVRYCEYDATFAELRLYVDAQTKYVISTDTLKYVRFYPR